MYIHFCAYMCTFFLVVAFRDARFLSGLYGRFSYIVTIRVEREGKKVRRNVGSFDLAQEAAVQRALAIAGFVDVASPASRAKRSKGAP